MDQMGMKLLKSGGPQITQHEASERGIVFHVASIAQVNI